jgi:hypothetical protein
MPIFFAYLMNFVVSLNRRVFKIQPRNTRNTRKEKKMAIVYKAESYAINDDHRAQLHNYLRATNFKLGLLVNFGNHPKVGYERIIR